MDKIQDVIPEDKQPELLETISKVHETSCLAVMHMVACLACSKLEAVQGFLAQLLACCVRCARLSHPQSVRLERRRSTPATTHEFPQSLGA